MRKVLAVDIGGTFIKWATIDEGYNIIDNDKFNTPQSYSELLISLEKVYSQHDIEGVSLSIPGGYDYRTNKAFAPNLTIINDKNILHDISKCLGADVIIENDGNLATLGEYYIAEGCKIDNMVLITLGTGVGGGAIINKKLLSGFATAFEIGHIIAKDDGLLCGCGRNGCFDEYGSRIGIINLYEELSGKRLEPIEIAKLYDIGDRYAVETFNKYADILAKSITDIANLLTPDKIKLGGGLSELYRCYFARLNDRFNDGLFPLYKGHISLEIAKLKNSAGLFGASIKYFGKI